MLFYNDTIILENKKQNNRKKRRKCKFMQQLESFLINIF